MDIYDIKIKDVDGNEISMSEYKGKVLIIFNSATKCGYTPQYEALEELYKKYQSEGLEILDFPSNQFLNQAPGSNKDLASFCQLKYGTSFKTFSKVDVNGKDASLLFKYLKKNSPKEINNNDKVGLIEKINPSKMIKWNFTKFLVNEKGEILYRFSPSYNPIKIEKYLVKLLNK